MARYWAHSDPNNLAESDPKSRWQPLCEHLRQVGELASMLANETKPGDEDFRDTARAAGLLHDLGKYTAEFQRKIRGDALKAPHSAHGAAWAMKLRSIEAAFAIAGHHSGLPDPRGGKACLRERTDAVRGGIEQLWNIAAADCPELSAITSLLRQTEATGEGFDLRTRMLFSCLVDADRIDTSGAHHRGAALAARERLARLLAFIEGRAAQVPDGPVKAARKAVLDACLAAAPRTGNILSLTVPTGGAKTLSSMAFALKRACAFPQVRRVIVVIPYLSIIEQNAQVFMDALGPDAILEHHSGDAGAEEDEDRYENPARRQATENWDAPVVVTTSVRFFESLFSDRPRDLRRVHNIARSVVILDEVQTLPRKLLSPILSMMEDLARNWDTTFLFCTATQPAFEGRGGDDPRWAPGTIQEIMPAPASLFGALKRVEVEWPGESVTWEKIAGALIECRRALCIVNTRGHAVKLYREVLSGKGPVDGVFHLSSRMCPKHRLKTIAAIKQALEDPSAACIVVSTQVVEAGVDFDFPVVYRAVGPLDSIAQAAGRCDREGHLTVALGRPGGKVIVFEPEDPATAPGVYKEATERTRAMIRQGNLSIDEPADIRRYFDRLYGEANLGGELQEMRKGLKFRSLGAEFEMIEDNTVSVFVPYDGEARELIAELDAMGLLDLKHRRGLQKYAVGLYRSELQSAAMRGFLYEVREGSGLWVCPEGFYDLKVGFTTEVSANDMVV